MAVGLTKSGASAPIRWTGWHQDSTVLSGNALTMVVDSQQLCNHYFVQAPNANGDSFTQNVFLASGTYTFSVLGFSYFTAAKVDWYLDGGMISSGQDWYAPVATENTLLVVTSVFVPSNGQHTLKGVVNGHNSSSTNYSLPLTKFMFKQASD